LAEARRLFEVIERRFAAGLRRAGRRRAAPAVPLTLAATAPSVEPMDSATLTRKSLSFAADLRPFFIVFSRDDSACLVVRLTSSTNCRFLFLFLFILILGSFQYRDIFAQRSRERDLMILFVDQNLANMFCHGVFA
jgi:hypothetical protein